MHCVSDLLYFSNNSLFNAVSNLFKLGSDFNVFDNEFHILGRVSLIDYK